MNGGFRYALLPLGRLRAHEEIVPADVPSLIDILRSAGEVREPLLVADRTWVILNGHHRYQALRAMGARRAPAWVVDYDDERITLDRWGPGEPISKAEVVRRAAAGELFPPKTTRHRLSVDLPDRPTPLTELGVRRDRSSTGRTATRSA